MAWTSDGQGLVTWWHLTNASAATPAIGWGPSANDGAYSGGLTFGGSAGVTFNGTTGLVTVPDDPSLDITGDWAIWCQIKRGATGAIRTIVSKGDKSYGLQLDATGKPQLVSNGVVIATASSAIPDTTVVHTVVGHRFGTNALIYLDGAQVANVTVSGNAAVNNAFPLKLGAHTTSGGASSQFYNGTIVAAAVMTGGGAAWGPFVGLKLRAGNWLPLPALATAWIDPASTANVSAVFDVLYASGRTPTQVGGVTWASTNNVPGGSAESAAIPLDAFGVGTITIPLATSQNGKQTATTIRGYGTTVTLIDGYAVGQWALARFAPNVALGDVVTALAVTPTMVGPVAGHTLGTFLRAAIGPGLGDYAGGSSWTTSPASAQGGLPARGAWLAVQLQLARTA